MQPAGQDTPAVAPGVFGAAILGRREEQQDSFRSVWLSEERAWLLVVADGMGGHAAGSVASRIAADAFVSAFAAKRSAGAALEPALQSALQDANSEIARHQSAYPETSGMGTTIVAAHVSADGLAWISVGDSPMWLFSKGAIQRVNEDHSFRPAVARGAAAIANMLQSVLNGEEIPLIDCRSEPLRMRSGDLVILASDGLLTLNDQEITRIVRAHHAAGPESIVRQMLSAVEAHAKPNQDNCAVLVAAVHGSAASSGGRAHRWMAAIAVIAIALISLARYFNWRQP